MQKEKGNIDLATIEQANQARRAQLANAPLFDVKELSTEQQTERLLKALCPCCFQTRSKRLGLAAITQRECALCDTTMRSATTATDLLCKPCAQANTLCIQCGADVELNPHKQQLIIAKK
jgi:hypothetical protein